MLRPVSIGLSRILQLAAVFLLSHAILACTSSSQVGPQGGGGGGGGGSGGSAGSQGPTVVVQAEQDFQQAEFDRRAAYALASSLEISIAESDAGVSAEDFDSIIAQIYSALGISHRFLPGDGIDQLIAAIESEQSLILNTLSSSVNLAVAAENCGSLGSDYIDFSQARLQELLLQPGKLKEDVSALAIKGALDDIFAGIKLEPNKPAAFRCGTQLTNAFAKLVQESRRNEGVDSAALSSRRERLRLANESLATAQVLRNANKIFDRYVEISLNVEQSVSETKNQVAHEKAIEAQKVTDAHAALESKKSALNQVRSSIQGLGEIEQLVFGEITIESPDVQELLDAEVGTNFDSDADTYLARYREEALAAVSAIKTHEARIENKVQELAQEESRVRSILTQRVLRKVREEEEAMKSTFALDRARYGRKLELNEKILPLYKEMGFQKRVLKTEAEIERLNSILSSSAALSASLLSQMGRSIEESGSDLDLLHATLEFIQVDVPERWGSNESLASDIVGLESQLATISRCKSFIEDQSEFEIKVHPTKGADFRAAHSPEDIAGVYADASRQFSLNRTPLESGGTEIACAYVLNDSSN